MIANGLRSNGNGLHSNGIAPKPALNEPDAHGQAALLLAESTLHILIEAGLLNRRDAIAAVETAADVKVDLVAATHESQGRMKESLALLARIQASFEADHAMQPNV